jgi:hypothetical protein
MTIAARSSLLSITACLLIGCAPIDLGWTQPTKTRPAPAPPPMLSQEEISAKQLAEIMGIDVWRFHYHGIPPLCWVEVEETNQDTLPDRMPETGFLGENAQAPDVSNSQGDIVFYWRKNPTDNGGIIHLKLDHGGTYGYGIGPGGFVFGWKGHWIRSDEYEPPQSGATLAIGEVVTLLTYDAQEITDGPHDMNNPDPDARRVVLRLKAKRRGQEQSE